MATFSRNGWQFLTGTPGNFQQEYAGRKNWLFSATAKGSQASAGIYSLIETAKANKLEPFWYLLYLFEKLPEARTEEDYNALLPYNVKKTALKSPVS